MTREAAAVLVSSGPAGRWAPGRRPRPVLLAVSVLALVASLLTVTPLPAVAAAPPRPQPSSRVSSRPVAARGVSPSASKTATSVSVPAPVWPAASAATVDVGATPTAVGGSPVKVGQAVDATSRPAGAGAPRQDVVSRVSVWVLDQEAAAAAGVRGVLVRVTRADGNAAPGQVAVSLDDSGWWQAFGGSWASRLVWVPLPECALSRGLGGSCAAGAPLESVSDLSAHTVSGVVTAAPDPAAVDSTADSTTADATGLLAVTATTTGQTGNYTATSLNPSLLWNAGGAGGEFSYQYPMRVPPVTGGLAPGVALRYSSGSVDGRTAEQNEQPSWVGQGWDYSPGYVEQSYQPCAQVSGWSTSGDMCDSATSPVLSLSFGGGTHELVQSGTSAVWRLRDDDGSRLTVVTSSVSNGALGNNAFKLQARDGTTYYFGLDARPGTGSGTLTNSVFSFPMFQPYSGRACYNATQSASYCTNAWRWNLDYVVDRHGNTMTYFYGQEGNVYWSRTANRNLYYIRGGYSYRIDYGQVKGSEGTAAPARVRFDVDVRCLSNCGSYSSPTTANWPDTPWDLNCDVGANCGTNSSPSFWTARRMTAVHTEVNTVTGYEPVDDYALTHAFPGTNDGTSPSLWLQTVQHTGRVGTGSLTTDAESYGSRTPPQPNRVDYNTSLGVPTMNKFRLSMITTASGAQVLVTYGQNQACTATSLPAPDTNYKDCFPRYYSPQGGTPGFAWWHKYLATQVDVVDRTGGSPTMTYAYAFGGDSSPNAPLWHHDYSSITPAAQQSWSDWRGYPATGVTTGSTGAQSYSDTVWLRGMDGDRKADGTTRSVTVTDAMMTITDSDRWSGYAFEKRQYSAPYPAGTVLTKQDYMPWSLQTASGNSRAANMVNTTQEVDYTWVAATSSWVQHHITTTFDGNGDAATVSDEATVDMAGGEANTDTCTKYTRVSNTTTAWLIGLPTEVKVYAYACSSNGTTMLSDAQTFYDGATSLTATPTTGDATKSQAKISSSGGWSTTTTVYDSYGRVTSVTDPRNLTTVTTYTDDFQGRTEVVETTTPLGTSRTDQDVELNLPIATTDINGNSTAMAYDALGRLSKVWLPTELPTTGPESLNFAYTYSSSAPLRVSSSILQQIDNGTPVYATGYVYYDSLGRQRETQVDKPFNFGRQISETRYDTRGNVLGSSGPTFAGGTAGSGLVNPNPASLPTDTVTSYDGLGRPITVATVSDGTTKWTTGYSYDGHLSTVTPPDGGATTTVHDPRGRTTRLTRHTTAGDQTTGYSYNPGGTLAQFTDPAGRITSYSYNWLGQRTQTIDPDTGTTTVGYTPAGDITSTTDGNNNLITTDYDSYGRPTTRWNGASGTGTKLASWAYDTLTGGAGQLTSSTRYDGTNTYTVAVTGYDARTRPTGTTWTIPAAEGNLSGQYTETVGYDRANHQTSITYPAAGGLAAETVTTGYDTTYETGLPTTLTGAATYINNVGYDDATNNPTTLALSTAAANMHRDYSYELATNRLTELKTSKAGAVIGDDTYTYTPTGDVTSTTDATDSQSQCYRYNDLHQLTDAWTTTGTCATNPTAAAVAGSGKYPYWDHYDIDLATGNRTQDVHYTATGSTTTNYTYATTGGKHPHFATSTTSTGQNPTSSNYTVDAAGNTATATTGVITTNYQYNPENSYTGATVHATGGDQTTTTLTDATGTALIRRDPGTTTLYIAGEELVLTGTTVTATRYYQLNGQTTAARTPSTLTWQLGDPQGSASIAINNTTGAITHRYYTPYGGDRAGASTWPTTHGYLDHQTNPTTNLLDDAARQYNPTTGHFLTPDPLTDPTNPDTHNPYNYANHNPITSSDPSGLNPEDAQWEANHPNEALAPSKDSGYNRYGAPEPVWAPPTTGPSNSGGNKVYTNGTVLSYSGQTYTIYIPGQPPLTLPPGGPDPYKIAEHVDRIVGAWDGSTGDELNGLFPAFAVEVACQDLLCSVSYYRALDDAYMQALGGDANFDQAMAWVSGGAGAAMAGRGALRRASGPSSFSNRYPGDPHGWTRPFSPSTLKGRTGNYQYVVLTDGTLIVGKGDGHLALARGADVAAAGEVRIKSGSIVEINNQSGHYKPYGSNAAAAAEGAFNQAGFDATGKYREYEFPD